MVFSTLFSIFRTGALLILLNDYLKREYPAKYDNLLIEIPLQLIYVYSKCQIIYEKLHLQLSEFIAANPHISEIYNKHRVSEIEYIVDGKIVATYKTTQTLPENGGDGLLIYSDYKTKCVPKKILPKEIIGFEYKISNVQFMLVELIINDQPYKINLKTEAFTYYIVDNIFDRKFFCYYLLNYNSLVTTADDCYTVKIIDHNVVMKEFEITNSNYIVIKENDYTYTTSE